MQSEKTLFALYNDKYGCVSTGWENNTRVHGDAQLKVHGFTVTSDISYLHSR